MRDINHQSTHLFVSRYSRFFNSSTWFRTVKNRVPSVTTIKGVAMTREFVDTHNIQGQETRTTSRSRFAPDSMLTGFVGLVLVGLGLIAVIRTGFEGSLSEPVREVVGMSHTATLGLWEIGIGLCLLLSAAAYSRTGQLFFGALLGIAGFIGAVQNDSFKDSLALDPGMGWIAAATGFILVLAVLLLPRVDKNSTTITKS
jgi:hypothetical protein